MKRKKNLNVCGLTRNPSRQKFHPQSFDVYNQLLVLFLSYHKYLKPFFKISFTANTCVWAPKDDLRWRLQAFQHHNPAQVSDSIFSMGSWELCVPLLLMFPVTFLKIQAVFSRYFTVRDWSTFCNKWPTNQQFFCQYLVCGVRAVDTKTRRKASREEVCVAPVGRCTPNLRCFCEISVCTVVALNCKPFQSVQIFVWLCFDVSDKFIWMQTAESRQRLSCLMKPCDCPFHG